MACTASKARNEKDFVAHIRRRVDSDPQTRKWGFVCDNLNTHLSESLVRYVAEESDMAIDLGITGKSGILKSKEARVAVELSVEAARTLVETIQAVLARADRGGFLEK